MTTINASCPMCGDVVLWRDQVRLVLHSKAPKLDFYSFTCPMCNDEVRKPAEPEVVRLLRMGGVVPEYITLPAEASEEHQGPPLTYDDLLDFLVQLHSSDTVATAALAELPRT